MKYNILKAKVLNTGNLSLLNYFITFTIIYVLEVIYACGACVVETCNNAPLCPILHSVASR